MFTQVEYMEQAEKDLLHAYNRFKVVLDKGDGVYLYDTDGKEYLDMCLVQRSGDMLAASCAGVNETQYAALMIMVARHCGYEVGMFSHIVMNEQIYSRHVEHVNTLLERYKELEQAEFYGKYIKQPKLVLNSNKTDFYSFTIDDFTLENYEPIKPQLRFELGI